jgi:hypothetical protein
MTKRLLVLAALSAMFIIPPWTAGAWPRADGRSDGGCRCKRKHPNDKAACEAQYSGCRVGGVIVDHGNTKDTPRSKRHIDPYGR